MHMHVHVHVSIYREVIWHSCDNHVYIHTYVHVHTVQLRGNVIVTHM